MFEFAAERFGYGTGMMGSAVTFALAVMYLYLSIMALYLFNRSCGRCGGWDHVLVVVLAPSLR